MVRDQHSSYASTEGSDRRVEKYSVPLSWTPSRHSSWPEIQHGGGCQILCLALSIRFVAVAPKNHESSAIVERANQSIRGRVSRLSLAEPRLTLVDLVTTATFHKNTLRGHDSSSSFELLYNRLLRLFTVCNPETHGSAEDNATEARWCQLRASPGAKTRACPSLNVGDSVYFWQDGKAWVRTAVVQEERNIVALLEHNGAIETAHEHRDRKATIMGLVQDEEGTEGNESGTPDVVHDANAWHGSPVRTRNRKINAEILS